jgi:hypothetical protein
MSAENLYQINAFSKIGINDQKKYIVHVNLRTKNIVGKP